MSMWKVILHKRKNKQILELKTEVLGLGTGSVRYNVERFSVLWQVGIASSLSDIVSGGGSWDILLGGQSGNLNYYFPYMYHSVHCSTIYNSQVMEAT